MPPIANITGYSVGQDLRTLLITGPFGNIDASLLGRYEEFNASPVITTDSVTPLNIGGVQLLRNIYHGWDGQVMFARNNSAMVAFQAAIMGTFNTQGQESYFGLEAVVVENITQVVNAYTFVNAVFHNGDFGRFAGAGKVNQALHFRAQYMLVNGQVLTAPIFQ